MAAIDPLTKEKVMRPSLIDTVDKVNEVVTAVNALDPAEIDALDTRVSTLETTVSSLNTRITNIQADITSIKNTNTSQQTDIDRMKVTLYTALSAGGE